MAAVVPISKADQFYNYCQEKYYEGLATPDHLSIQAYESVLVFFYGTFKRGFSRNPFLSDCEFMHYAFTSDNHFRMGYSIAGGYPAAFVNKAYTDRGRIFGELWRVPTHKIRALDNIESNGHYFNRVKVKLEVMHEGKVVELKYPAFMYIGDQKVLGKTSLSFYDITPMESPNFGVYYTFRKEMQLKTLGKFTI